MMHPLVWSSLDRLDTSWRISCHFNFSVAVTACWSFNTFAGQGHLGAAVIGAHPGLMHKPCMRVEGACASGGLAFACALEAVRAGADVTLAVGAEVQTTVSARQGGDFLARAAHFRRQRSLDDFVFPALFARRAKACSEAFGITPLDLARVSVKAYANAALNPKAHMHAASMSLEVCLPRLCSLFLSQHSHGAFGASGAV